MILDNNNQVISAKKTIDLEILQRNAALKPKSLDKDARNFDSADKYSNRLLFLGISGDKYALSRQLSSSGGLYLNIKSKDKSHKILVNPGIGLLNSLNKADISIMEFDTVLALSDSIKRVGELNNLLALTSYFGEDPRITLVASPLVLDNVIAKENKNTWHKLHYATSEKTISFEDYKITFIPTYQYKTKAIHENDCGFVLITKDYKLCYVGDTDYSKKLLRYYNSDILILNVVDYQADKQETGLSVEDAILILREIKPKLCIIMGYSCKLLKQDPLTVARKIYTESKVTCIAARDGLSIAPTDYAKSNQKTLLGL